MTAMRCDGTKWSFWFQYMRTSRKHVDTLCCLAQEGKEKYPWAAIDRRIANANYKADSARKVAFRRAMDRAGFTREDRPQFWEAYFKMTAGQKAKGAS